MIYDHHGHYSKYRADHALHPHHARLQRVQLYREIRVHSKLQHQNIAQFYSSFLVGGGRGVMLIGA